MTSIPALPAPAAAGVARSGGAGAAGSTASGQPSGFLAALGAATTAESAGSGSDATNAADHPWDDAPAADCAAALDDVLTQLGLQASWTTPAPAAMETTPAPVSGDPTAARAPLAAAIAGMRGTSLADALPGTASGDANLHGPPAGTTAGAPTPAGLVGARSDAPLQTALTGAVPGAPLSRRVADAGGMEDMPPPDTLKATTLIEVTPQAPAGSAAPTASSIVTAGALPRSVEADPALPDRRAAPSPPPAPDTVFTGPATPPGPVPASYATTMASTSDPVPAGQPQIPAAEGAFAAAVPPGGGESLRMDADGPHSTPLQATFAPPETRAAEAAARPAPLLAPVPMPSSPEDGFDQVLATRIGWMADKGIGHARIHVTPEHLGSIDLQIRLDGDSLSAEFHSSQADVRSALESGLARLREQLADHGLKLVQAQVGDGQRGDGDRRPAAGESRSEGPALHAGTVEVATAPAGTPRRGLVDAWA